MTKLVNRAKMTTATTGTGTITLGSAVDGYQTFSDAGVVNSDVVRYTIEDGDAWEIGSGTYSSGTLTRVLDESSTGSLLNLSGDAVVYVTAAGDDIQQPPSEGPFVDGDKTKLDGIEAGATADQTAGEIKIAYESNANTNAFTDAEQTKLAGIEATADVTDAGNVNPLVDAHLNTSSATSGEYLSWTGSDYDWVAVSGYTDADVDTHLNTGTASSGEVLSWNGTDYDWITSGGAFTEDASDNLYAIATLPDLTTGINNFAAGFTAADNLTSGTHNVAVGYAALFSTTTGSDNVALGYFAGRNGNQSDTVSIGKSAGQTGGFRSVSIGYFASYFNTSYRRIAIGDSALRGVAGSSTGAENIGIGKSAGYDLTTGATNVLVGSNSGENLTTGSNNVALGNGALDAATVVTDVIAIGADAAENASNNAVVAIGKSAVKAGGGYGSVGVGINALYSDTGLRNVAIGVSAGYFSTGDRNTFIGESAGYSTPGVTTGSNNTLIGAQAAASSATVSNEITLGNSGITRFRVPGAGIDNTSAALSGTTPSVDVGARDTYTLSTSGNTTFTFTGAPSSGQVGTFSLIITAGGTHTLTWPASVDWAGGTAPDAPASGEKDIYTFMTVDGGTTWYGFLAGDAMA